MEFVVELIDADSLFVVVEKVVAAAAAVVALLFAVVAAAAELPIALAAVAVSNVAAESVIVVAE